VAVSLREWPVVVRAIVPGRRLVDIESVRATSTDVLPVTRRGVAVVIALDSSSSAAGTKPRAATDDGCTQLLVIATTATAIEATRTTLPGNTVVAEIAVPIGASGLGVLSGYVDGTSNGHVPAGEQVHRGIGRVPAELHGHACGDIDRGVIEDPGFGKLDLGIHGRIERTVGARAPAIESQDRRNAEPHAQGGDKRCAGERCHVFHDLFLSLVCVSGCFVTDLWQARAVTRGTPGRPGPHKANQCSVRKRYAGSRGLPHRWRPSRPLSRRARCWRAGTYARPSPRHPMWQGQPCRSSWPAACWRLSAG